MSGEESIVDQAIGWHVAQADMAEDRWEEFVAWLELSPAHAQTYDRIASLDEAVGVAAYPLHAANDDAPAGHGLRWGWLAGGVAAAVALVAVGLPLANRSASSPYEVATKAGERRSVTLADGTLIELSGGTRVRLDPAAPRAVALEAGEATLHVTHDGARPFTVTSGSLSVRDMGTVFDLSRDGDTLAVAVSEGSVLVEPGREALPLRAGDALTMRETTRAVTRTRVTPDSVGGWRSGVLAFDGQPIGTVLGTVNRLYATDIVLTDDLSHRPFTGIIRLTGAADRDVPHLAALIGANWRRDGKRWILAGAEPALR